MALAPTDGVAQSYSMGSALPPASAGRPRVWVAHDLFVETVAPLHRAAGRIASRYPRLPHPSEPHELRHRLSTAAKRAGLVVASLSLLFCAFVVHYVYVDRSDMPDLE